MTLLAATLVVSFIQYSKENIFKGRLVYFFSQKDASTVLCIFSSSSSFGIFTKKTEFN